MQASQWFFPVVPAIAVLGLILMAASEPQPTTVRKGRDESGAATSQPSRSPKNQKESEQLIKRPAPKAGSMAPDFTLATLDGKERITLSKLHADRPVVLIFGSFT